LAAVVDPIGAAFFTAERAEERQRSTRRIQEAPSAAYGFGVVVRGRPDNVSEGVDCACDTAAQRRLKHIRWFAARDFGEEIHARTARPKDWAQVARTLDRTPRAHYLVHVIHCHRLAIPAGIAGRRRDDLAGHTVIPSGRPDGTVTAVVVRPADRGARAIDPETLAEEGNTHFWIRGIAAGGATPGRVVDAAQFRDRKHGRRRRNWTS